MTTRKNDEIEMTQQDLREEILNLVSRFHKSRNEKSPFTPGETPVKYAGRVFDEKEGLVLTSPTSL